MKDLNRIIIETTQLTSNREINYPELYKYIEEMPVTIPSEAHPNLEKEILRDYLESLKELSDTGCVEFIGEIYSHSLAGITTREEFARQAEAHSAKINELFGAKPKVFQIPEMSYTDALGEIICDLGFKTVRAEISLCVCSKKSG